MGGASSPKRPAISRETTPCVAAQTRRARLSDASSVEGWSCAYSQSLHASTTGLNDAAATSRSRVSGENSGIGRPNMTS